MDQIKPNTFNVKLNFTYYAYASFFFVMLKIFFGLDWAWGWVLAPIYLLMAPIAVFLSLLTVGLVFLGIIAFVVLLADILERR